MLTADWVAMMANIALGGAKPPSQEPPKAEKKK